MNDSDKSNLLLIFNDINVYKVFYHYVSTSESSTSVCIYISRIRTIMRRHRRKSRRFHSAPRFLINSIGLKNRKTILNYALLTSVRQISTVRTPHELYRILWSREIGF